MQSWRNKKQSGITEKIRLGKCNVKQIGKLNFVKVILCLLLTHASSNINTDFMHGHFQMDNTGANKLKSIGNVRWRNTIQSIGLFQMQTVNLQYKIYRLKLKRK